MFQGQKGWDLTQFYDKSPYTNRNVKRAKWQHKQRHKKFDKTAIADRLRTASWSNYSHPTGLVNRFTGPPSHSPKQPCNQKDTQLNDSAPFPVKVLHMLRLKLPGCLY